MKSSNNHLNNSLGIVPTNPRVVRAGARLEGSPQASEDIASKIAAALLCGRRLVGLLLVKRVNKELIDTRRPPRAAIDTLIDKEPLPVNS